MIVRYSSNMGAKRNFLWPLREDQSEVYSFHVVGCY